MRLEPFHLIREHREVVEEALRQGACDGLFGTQLTVADGSVLCALRDGDAGLFRPCALGGEG